MATPGTRRVERRTPGLRDDTHHDDRWLERLARWGYAAKGVVYLTIGVSGLLVAVGLAERVRGSPGAMYVLVGLPLGRVLGGALAVGLAGYAALSLVAAVRDPEGNGRTVRGLLARTIDAGAGLVYAALAASGVRLLVDPGRDAVRMGEAAAERLLDAPGGEMVLVAAGLGMVAGGVALGIKAVAGRFAHRFERRRMRPGLARTIVRLARVGTAARGVLFALTGTLLVRAGWASDAEVAGDFGDALTGLATRPAGPVLVALVSGGCVA